MSAAAEAFAAYLRVRDRLPADGPRPAGAARAAPDLAAVAGEYDLILLDAYGVLNVGETRITGAARAIAGLRAAGKRVMVVSNSAGYDKAHMMARYARLGFDFAPDEVVTSREALLAHLGPLPRRRWGAMLGTSAGLAEFGGLDVTVLGDDPEAYEAAEGFLLIGSDGWTEARQRLLETALRTRPRPVLVGNPDIVAPREDGLSLEPGHFAHRLADETGVMPQFFGKPFPAIYDLALARWPVVPARVLMVGDTLHTDILGGRHMGFGTALVTGHGSLKGLDVADAIARAGIAPDHVLPAI